MTTTDQVKQLEKDLRLSETLRRGLERDVAALEQQLESVKHVARESGESIERLAAQNTELEEQLAHIKTYLVQDARDRGRYLLDHAQRVDNLLNENSRLVELRREAEARLGVVQQSNAAWRAQFEGQREITIACATHRDRLLRGEFTPEEIHGFCHRLRETVPREEFERGCRAYQEKLYGPVPSDQG